MIAAVCSWHERHAAAAAAIEHRLARGERRAVAAYALVEVYSVLTRLPSPHRLAPRDAWTLVHANFMVKGRIVTLAGAEYARLLARLAEQGIGGGRVYDAVIGECARRAGAGVLLTLNKQDFDPSPDGVSIIEP
jgi:predicted nucleic acid-binding protein